MAIDWRIGAAVAAVAAAGLLWALVAGRPHATSAVEGRVVAINDGQPISHASVTATLPQGSAGPRAVTVFTDVDGRYRLAGLKSASAGMSIKLSARKLGYEQVAAPAGAGTGRLYLDPVANIAPDAPASAWLTRLPEGQDKNITIPRQASHGRPSRHAMLSGAVAPTTQHDRQVCRLAFLAPQIQAQLFDVAKPQTANLRALLKTPLPLAWCDQATWLERLSRAG